MKVSRQKRIAAIHDISGIGKCSLTAAIPVISASGIETAVMPTAVLSTHTGNITGFTYRDLTEDMVSFYNHWKTLGVEFDGIYSGFLGSAKQVDIVCDFIDKFRKPETVILVDPAMADSGLMYTTFNKEFAKEMKKLCKKADIIVPNITEAVFLLGEEYSEPPYSVEYINDLLIKLSQLGPSMVVLTGVHTDENKISCFAYDKSREEFFRCDSERYRGTYYGTGDIFASALLGAYMNGKDIFESTAIALEFTCGAVKRTFEAGTDTRLGVNFEQGIADYIKKLEG